MKKKPPKKPSNPVAKHAKQKPVTIPHKKKDKLEKQEKKEAEEEL